MSHSHDLQPPVKSHLAKQVGRLFDNKTEAAIAEDYKKGDKLIKIAEKYGCSTRGIVGALNRVGIDRRKGGTKYILNEEVFDNSEGSEEASYFVGLIMADGCVYPKGDSHVLALGLSGEDSEMIYRFRSFLGSNHRIGTYRSTQAFLNALPYSRIMIYSSRLVTALAKYGITPRKSLTASASYEMTSNRHFWRGCVDGDGFLTLAGKKAGKQYPSIGLMGSQYLLGQFSEYINKMAGCRTTVRKMIANNAHVVSTCGVPAVRIIRELYGSCSVALARKQTKAKELLKHSYSL